MKPVSAVDCSPAWRPGFPGGILMPAGESRKQCVYICVLKNKLTTKIK
ncbi:hypothetical protein GRZ40_002721 [Salmonella bongori]|nr:hypothetical protein [Salmonella bongori]EDS3899031.1 hypothetical protein [Salmonella enterica subsp. enterica]EDU0236962.1 hypothetical protein [Salmonella enterica subsp. enterica serovar Lattenkamp]HAF1592198.1 hypothetical protein [Salmonella enterica]EDP8725591.1 hypothetical protein [Salmonella bongori]